MSRPETPALLRILLVEDYEHDREAFRHAFRHCSAATHITECVRAEEAIELLAATSEAFDLVVVDHGLPGKDGFALCRELLERRVDVPLVILTGRGSEALAVEALKAGVDDYLIKDPARGYLELLPVVLSEVAHRFAERRARQRAEAALVASRRELEQVVANTTVPTFVIDRGHRVTRWNRALENLTGIRAEEVVGTDQHWRAFYARERPILANLIVEAAPRATIEDYYPSAGQFSSVVEGAYEAEGFFPDLGEAGRWLSFSAAPLRDAAGAVIGAIETLQDITARKRAEVALFESNDRLMQTLGGVNVPTFVIDQHHAITHWNKALETLSGLPSAEMVGTRRQWQAFYAEERPVLADLIVSRVGDAQMATYYGREYRRSSLIEGAYEAEGFFPALGGDGEWLFFTAAPLRDAHGVIVGAVETLQNITARKRAEAALRDSRERYRRLSVTDGLTSLFNSRHFYSQIKAETARAARYGHPLSLLLLDADNFKCFNDTYGHLAGDRVLTRLADVIRECLRGSDSAYRYGGEEFVVLLPETARAEAEAVAERLRQAFAALRFKPEGDAEVQMTVSVGISQFRPGEEVTAFIKRADRGTYRAKALGKNRVMFESD